LTTLGSSPKHFGDDGKLKFAAFIQLNGASRIVITYLKSRLTIHNIYKI
jgi:hypothetical protein